jgi:myo-inositol-1-phosphate synthase
LKVTLAESFRRRNIELESWYSLNLIGNHDGLVLSDPEFAVAKLADKTDALHPQPDQSHKVRIEYVPPWGDAKESWDAVEARSWLGSRVTLRINWRGHDSELAAPLVLDLARLLVHSASLGRTGFQANLGFFFKRPFLRENTSISERWSELVQSFDAQLEK